MSLNSSSLPALWFFGFTGQVKPGPIPPGKRLFLFSALVILALPFTWALHWALGPVSELVLKLGAQFYYSVTGTEFTFSNKGGELLLRSRRPAFESLLDLQAIMASQPILWALLLASPGLRMLNRLKIAVLGSGFLWISYITFIICKVEVTLIAAGHPQAGSAILWNSIDNFFEITGKGFFPIAIWLLLTLNYLLGDMDRRKPLTVGEVGRNDPCPCGSGKKFKNCCLP
jgi:SEC-C motif